MSRRTHCLAVTSLLTLAGVFAAPGALAAEDFTLCLNLKTAQLIDDGVGEDYPVGTSEPARYLPITVKTLGGALVASGAMSSGGCFSFTDPNANGATDYRLTVTPSGTMAGGNQYVVLQRVPDPTYEVPYTLPYFENLVYDLPPGRSFVEWGEEEAALRVWVVLERTNARARGSVANKLIYALLDFYNPMAPLLTCGLAFGSVTDPEAGGQIYLSTIDAPPNWCRDVSKRKFVLAHELGHVTQSTSTYSGGAGTPCFQRCDYPEGDGNGGHWLHMPEHTSCARGEAYADFISLATWNSTSNSHPTYHSHWPRCAEDQMNQIVCYDGPFDLDAGPQVCFDEEDASTLTAFRNNQFDSCWLDAPEPACGGGGTMGDCEQGLAVELDWLRTYWLHHTSFGGPTGVPASITQIQAGLNRACHMFPFPVIINPGDDEAYSETVFGIWAESGVTQASRFTSNATTAGANEL